MCVSSVCYSINLRTNYSRLKKILLLMFLARSFVRRDGKCTAKQTHILISFAVVLAAPFLSLVLVLYAAAMRSEEFTSCITRVYVVLVPLVALLAFIWRICTNTCPRHYNGVSITHRVNVNQSIVVFGSWLTCAFCLFWIWELEQIAMRINAELEQRYQ